jgi:hypothetical protein
VFWLRRFWRQLLESRDHRRHVVEIAVAIVISVAGLMTSWSAYQDALWSGRQAAHYTRSGRYRVQATNASLQAAVTQTWQIGLVVAWVDAKVSGKDRLAGFYQSRMPPDLKPAFEAWAATDPIHNPDAPNSPFRMAGYEQPGLAQAAQLEAKANQEFAEGQRANRISDAFTRSAVILAMSMFFGGILQVFESTGVRVALALVSVISCVVGIERVFTLPFLTLEPPF